MIPLTPFTEKTLAEIIAKHRKWQNGEEGGQRAILRGADLQDAILRNAILQDADLRGADLRGADLRGADLQGADLQDAILRNADLRGADLQDAENLSALVAARTLIAPQGVLIVWKKCRDGVIVQLSIPAEARRSNATGRKCRAEFVDVLAILDGEKAAEVAISSYDGKTEYRVGQRVTAHEWCEDRWQECAGGIHFYLTREEAEAG